MGYESRVIIVDHNNLNGYIFGTTIADIRLSKIESQIIDTFDKEIDFDLYGDNTKLTYDKYGKKCKYCTLSELLEVLDGFKSENRRVAVLESLARSFDNETFGDMNLIAVHYGY